MIGSQLRRLLVHVLGLSALAALTGCQTTASGGTDVACRAFGPISWAKADTVETVHQVQGHNAAWTALCPRKPSQ